MARKPKPWCSICESPKAPANQIYDRRKVINIEAIGQETLNARVAELADVLDSKSCEAATEACSAKRGQNADSIAHSNAM